uniref:Nucleoside diphosphate kinase n=2 Tax=Nothobranchius TaxID=28779 RepID=A0A8C6NIH8_NOTFU
MLQFKGVRSNPKLNVWLSLLFYLNPVVSFLKCWRTNQVLFKAENNKTLKKKTKLPIICKMFVLFLIITPAGGCWTGANERTFLAVKPDGVQRKLVGEIVRRFEKRGFKLVGLKLVKASEDVLREHYWDLRNKPFFSRLISYMSSGPVVAMVWQGLDVVKTARKMLGETNPADSLPGTIRGDFCVEVGKNVIHGSDSMESAMKEISLWFGQNELHRWESCSTSWIY